MSLLTYATIVHTDAPQYISLLLRLKKSAVYQSMHPSVLLRNSVFPAREGLMAAAMSKKEAGM